MALFWGIIDFFVLNYFKHTYGSILKWPDYSLFFLLTAAISALVLAVYLLIFLFIAIIYAINFIFDAYEKRAPKKERKRVS
ncbi:hypothetical protein COZ22_03285 [bacterium (Candidatus Howlettbacteria) CG_4_10_14_3_um_filter_37_10]|nr:MAG: hypothetical protein COZ22_03285 [bacterium (Candidatus Howlettbacteria) CG_4_10_14_3_um_filter_37_10]